MAEDIVSNEGQPDNGVTPVSLEKRFLNIKTLASFAIAFAIIAFTFSRLDIDPAKLVDSIRQVNPLMFILYVFLGFLIYYAGFWLRGLRWQVLLKNVDATSSPGSHMPSSLRLSEMVLLNWFANCIIPARLGDAYRGYLLKRNARIGFSVGIGTIVAERMMDMMILFALLALAALGFMGSKNMGLAITMLEVGFGMAVLMFLILVAMRFLGGSIQNRLPKRLQAAYGRFQHGTLASFRQLPLLATTTVVIWLVEAGRLFFVGQSLGLSVALSLILFVALANSIITVIPLTPGGLGLAEVGIVGLLMIGSVSKETAVSVALVDRAISYWSIVVVGLITFLVSRNQY